MNKLTDKELDMLFEQSAQRQQIVEHINAEVMKTVKRDMRLKVLRKWARLLGICFGVPLLVVIYVYALFTYMPDMQLPLRIATFALPLGTVALWAGKELHDFLPADM